ncbi:MAG TPA: helix-turn-helix domain-containing protein [Pirellulales bacterium]
MAKKKSGEQKPLLTVKETADMLGVTKSRVSQLIKRKKLNVAEQVGTNLLIRRDEVEERVRTRREAMQTSLKRLKAV